MSSVLWVDRRVGSKELLPLLRKVGLDAQLTTLHAGDFAFDGNGPDGPVSIGVERKTIGDLVGSLQGGRLQGLQYDRLHATYDYVWVLVEGVWGQDKHGRLTIRNGIHGMRRLPGCHMTADGLTKALLTLETKGGIRLKQTFDRQQSVVFLSALIRWWTEKVWDGHTTLLTPYAGHQIVGKVSLFRQMVMRLPCLGPAASLAAERQFGGSLDRLLHSTVADWAGLETISPRGPRRLGEGKAARIVKTIQQLR